MPIIRHIVRLMLHSLMDFGVVRVPFFSCKVAVTTDQCIYYWGKNLHRPVSVFMQEVKTYLCKEIVHFYTMLCCLSSQRPGTNIQSLKEYKRSRQRQAASAPIANTLIPQVIADTKLDDVIVQVRFIGNILIAFKM